MKPTNPVLSVVVPAFNEEDTIVTVLKSLVALSFVKEIIVIDDGSTDGTARRVEKFEHEKVRLIRQPVNLGKTAAVKRGLKEASAPISVIQDADLEYDPQELDELIRPIVENYADVVYGSRFLVRRAARVLYYYHYLGNKLITFISNILTNVNFTDIETCYKAFRTPLVRDLPMTSKGFGLEVEITVLLSRTRARLYEVPISYYGRTYEEGKKIAPIDGVMALYYLVLFRFVAIRRRKYKQYIESANAFLAATSQ